MEQIAGKIKNEEKLTHEELFKFSNLPLMHSTKDRNELIHAAIQLAKNILDENE